MNLGAVVEVGAAGGAGAVGRVALDALAGHRVAGGSPTVTVVINVSGSFVLGLLVGLRTFDHASATLVLVGGTGVCGGYTTFSGAVLDAVRAASARSRRAAATLVAVTAVGALLAAAAGFYVAAV